MANQHPAAGCEFDDLFPTHVTHHGIGKNSGLSATYIREDIAASPVVPQDKSKHLDPSLKHPDAVDEMDDEVLERIRNPKKEPSPTSNNASEDDFADGNNVVNKSELGEYDAAAALYLMHEEEIEYTVTISSDPDGCDAHDFSTMINLESLLGKKIYNTIIKALKSVDHSGDEFLIQDWEHILGEISRYKIQIDDEVIHRLNDGIRALTTPAEGVKVQEGYALVPIEPTKELLVDIAAACRNFYSESGEYPRSKMVHKTIIEAALRNTTEE